MNAFDIFDVDGVLMVGRLPRKGEAADSFGYAVPFVGPEFEAVPFIAVSKLPRGWNPRWQLAEETQFVRPQCEVCGENEDYWVGYECPNCGHR